MLTPGVLFAGLLLLGFSVARAVARKYPDSPTHDYLISLPDWVHRYDVAFGAVGIGLIALAALLGRRIKSHSSWLIAPTVALAFAGLGIGLSVGVAASATDGENIGGGLALLVVVPGCGIMVILAIILIVDGWLTDRQA